MVKEYPIESTKIMSVDNTLWKNIRKRHITFQSRKFNNDMKKLIKLKIKWVGYEKKTPEPFNNLNSFMQLITFTRLIPEIYDYDKQYKPNKEKKIISYARTSGIKETNKEASFHTQITQNLNFVKKTKSYVDIHLEHNGVSGRINHKRKDFNQVFKPDYLSENDIKYILVYKLDRLSRNYYPILRFIHLCHYHDKLDDNFVNHNILNPENHKKQGMYDRKKKLIVKPCHHKTILVETISGKNSKDHPHYFIEKAKIIENEYIEKCINNSRYHGNRMIRDNHVEFENSDDEFSNSDNTNDDDDTNNSNNESNSFTNRLSNLFYFTRRNSAPNILINH